MKLTPLPLHLPRLQTYSAASPLIPTRLKAKQWKTPFNCVRNPQHRANTSNGVTSFESMHDFVSSINGLGTKLQVLATILHNTEIHSPLVQAYTMHGIPFRSGPILLVACHTIPHPYTLFYCHDF
ncbi:hypothetical protein AMTR_s00059p00082790 [Amborella trichopoda]|uniref:BURP domain-containing protein n=1 Tax=Amborella trichopoda TaxID=13333 RepID=U5D522_AMBTC|nr:hypothetical protein AMTR_s00059p00082790 [Amborella trichopoda]